MKRNRQLPLVLSSFPVVLSTVLILLFSPNAKAATRTDIQSENYAGYQISIAQNPKLISGVIMRWQVPAINCIKGGKPISGEVGVWPGLGTGTDNNHLLAQMGTASQCTNGKNTYWAWWQVYPFTKFQPLSHFQYPVLPEDDVIVDVSYGGNRYQFGMIDYTQGWHFGTDYLKRVNAPQTIEWMIEDVNHALLPQFAPVNLTNCTWEQGPPNVSLPEHAISVGTNVTEYDIFANAGIFVIQKTVTFALNFDGNAFDVKWKNY